MGAARLSRLPLQEDRRDPSAHHCRFYWFLPSVLFVKNQIQCEPSGPPHLLKAHREPFYVANRGACVRVMTCDCVFCSLSGGQRAPWWTARRVMRGTSPTEPVIALRADFLSHTQLSALAGSLWWIINGQCFCLCFFKALSKLQMLPVCMWLCDWKLSLHDASQSTETFWSWTPATIAMLSS